MATKRKDSEEFRKHVTNIFRDASSRILPLQKACGVQATKDLIPSTLLSGNDAEIDVKYVEMRTSLDKKGIIHHYSVSWMDVKKPSDVSVSENEKNVGKALNQKKIKKPEKTVERSVRDSESPTKSESEEGNTETDLKKVSSTNKISDGLKTGRVKCDGPCGREVSQGDVVQFGCDHVICGKCRRSQKSSALFDGSPGCCQPECLDKARRDGLQLRSGRRHNSLSSSMSVLSNKGPWEVLHVRICVIKKWRRRVYRTQLDYEFPSQARLAELTSTLNSYRDTIKCGRSYYSMTKPTSCDDLQPISLIDTNLRFYHLPGYKALSGGSLFVLIVGDGVHLY